MTTVLGNKTGHAEQVFEDFFRSYKSTQDGSKYRKLLARVAIRGGKSLIIDFEDLIAFDPALARNIMERPDQHINFASSAASAQMRVEDPEFSSQVGRISARFRRLPERTSPGKIGAEDIGKLVLLGGAISEISQVELMLVRAVFRCRKCLEIIVQEQEGELIRGPGTHCPFCKQSTSFELIEEKSEFVDCQNVMVKDSSSRNRGRTTSVRHVEAALKGDLVDTLQPQDEVDLTAIARVRKSRRSSTGLGGLAFYLDVNYVEKVTGETGRSSSAL